MNLISLHHFQACTKALRLHCFMLALRPWVLRQHCFMPPSQTVRDHPHSLLRDRVILNLRGQTCHSSCHTHCLLCTLHAEVSIKPIGRLSVIPLLKIRLHCEHFQFHLSVYIWVDPQVSLSIAKILEVSCPQDRAKVCLLFMYYIVYTLYMLVLICLLLSTEIYVYV